MIKINNFYIREMINVYENVLKFGSNDNFVVLREIIDKNFKIYYKFISKINSLC